VPPIVIVVVMVAVMVVVVMLADEVDPLADQRLHLVRTHVPTRRHD
jgi:hypothetical protein